MKNKFKKRLICTMLAGILAIQGTMPVYAAEYATYEQTMPETEIPQKSEQSVDETDLSTEGTEIFEEHEAEQETEIVSESEEEADGESEQETDTEINKDQSTDDETALVDDEPLENMTYVSEKQGNATPLNSDVSTYASLPTVEISASEGNVVVGIPGAYVTESAETMLERLNEIRLEACQKGIIDPNTGNALTEADYKPLQWSSDMEAIARQRAAEADINWEHTRPNGLRCFSAVTSTGEQSWAENLAWNGSGIMKGIEQWYDEKDDWVNSTPGAVTGHYESIISTRYNYVGIGAFKSTDNYYYAIAQEFSYKTSLDTSKDSTEGSCEQAMEIKGSHVNGLKFDRTAINVQEGETTALSLTAMILTEPKSGFSAYLPEYYTAKVLEAGTWNVSNQDILTVNKKGEVTALKKGEATITVTAGSQTASIDVIVIEEGDVPVVLKQLPTKRTYLVGDELDLSGIILTDTNTGEAVNLTDSMVSGFSSDKTGISTVTINYNGYIISFDTLIVEKPSLKAQCGQTLSQVDLPSSTYGTYTWENPEQTLESAGVNIYNANFKPNDTDAFNELKGIEVEVSVYSSLGYKNNITLSQNIFTYDGNYHEPEVSISVGDNTLVESIDYELTYSNNKDAGYAQVSITGKGYYRNTLTMSFYIIPATLTIKAKDVNLKIGDAIPQTYEYEIIGLVEGDSLITEPTLSCDIQSTTESGVYDIIPNGTDAGSNYNIEYVKGTLTVSEESTSPDVPTPDTPSSNIPTIEISASEGNVVVGIPGTYYTETAEKMLKRLNEIRLEACKQGVINPNTGKALTLSDYVPLQWSSDMEAIARLRAAEADITWGHTRPNGLRCFSAVTSNREQSWAENLAWNGSGIMQGIEQWYAEKKDWVNKTPGAVTGHYTSIINPGHTQVGIGAFKSTGNYYYAIAQEFSYKTSLDTTKDSTQGSCEQAMEIKGSQVSKLEFDQASIIIEEGGSAALPLTATIKTEPMSGFASYLPAHYTGNVIEAGSWNISNQNILTVNKRGEVKALSKGTTTITVSAGTQTASINVTVVGKGEIPIVMAALPAKTTYLTGEKLDLSGGSLLDTSTGKTINLTNSMVNGFSSDKAGISTVFVNYNGYVISFDTLIVGKPKARAGYGQKLSQVNLPSNEYGIYTWEDPNQVMDTIGINTCKASFKPNDTNIFSELNGIETEVSVYYSFGNDISVILKQDTFIYNGVSHEPKAVISLGDTILTESVDYELNYSNNKNAGIAQVTVTGTGYYEGNITKNFEILPASLTIKAKNVNLVIGESIPRKYEYDIIGLADGDTLITEPTFSCDIQNTTTVGVYDIIPSGAAADANYNPDIEYVKGTLTVSDERVSYTVRFDVQGKITTFAPEPYIGVKSGQTVEPPAEPVAEGYIFEGWYQDPACTKVWNFESDIVQSDITLYAKWLLINSDAGNNFHIQEISDIYYTGSAQKPSFSVYDGDTLLKLNKDYKVVYCNNTNANSVDSYGQLKLKKGNGMGADFDETLPYVTITGKGNYTDSLKVNFNILPAEISYNGFTLKYTDQTTVNISKEFKPFKSIKYKKAMKVGKDFEVVLKSVNSYDETGNAVESGRIFDNAVIPKGYSGSFILTVKGIGNYSGSISQTVYVSDKDHLIKNAKITIGKNLIKIKYEGKAVELTPSYYDSERKAYYRVRNGEITQEEIAAADAFSVKCGNNQLIYRKDFDITYLNNKKVGKATLIITGIGEYAGAKSATFNITGEPFNTKNITVEGLSDKSYTGTAITQNRAALTYAKGTEQEKTLVYGTDYTISYKKNINKGTATITYTAVDGSNFSGKFNKSFKITAADINSVKRDEGMSNISTGYKKSGVTPSEQIKLTNESGAELVSGRDYSVSYRNNKAVANVSDENKPTIIIKGKGNYSGTLEIPFTITKAELSKDMVTIKAIAYNPKKAQDYAYKPSVKLMDNKSALKEKVDYNIEYLNNTQSSYETYMENPESAASYKPIARITAVEGSNYTLANPIEVELPVYKNKLSKNNVYVVVDEVKYTGEQVTPNVKVYYSNDKNLISQAKNTTNEQQLIDLGLVKLNEDSDYTLSYGANIKAGKNKGSVKISGLSPYYGADITLKFTIDSKGIAW